MTIMQRSLNSHLKKRSTLRDLALGVWEADDEDDLIEEITSASGWCIKSIDLRHSTQGGLHESNSNI